MNLFRKSLSVDPDAALVTYGHLFFRVAAGSMIFYVHGLHKLEGWIAYARRGTSWELLQEVEGMHFPAPYAAAVAATLIQFVCSLFIVAGLFTRMNALLLLGPLGGAVSQNLLAGRSPQLALMYILVVVTLVLIGGGRISFDAKLQARMTTS